MSALNEINDLEQLGLRNFLMTSSWFGLVYSPIKPNPGAFALKERLDLVVVKEDHAHIPPDL